MDGPQQLCQGAIDAGANPVELASVAEELAKTSAKVCGVLVCLVITDPTWI